jgi:hypothetical protein
MELYAASKQWSKRPADERFWTLSEMLTATEQHRVNAVQGNATLGNLSFIAQGDDVLLTGSTGKTASLGHYAFGQASRIVGAPADYLRTLPAELASNCLNNGLKNTDHDRGIQLLLNRGSTMNCRSITSDRYSRIWNCDIVKRVQPLEEMGWRTPPARPACDDSRARRATESDCLKNRMDGLGIKPGDMIAPAGLYASDKDMFAFLINEDRMIDAGGGSKLARGVFIENSEVGDRAFKITTFLYNSVCGNHIVWGASQVNELRVVHVGEANDKAFGNIRAELREYADESVSDMEAKIKSAKKLLIGSTKDEVVNTLFAKRISGFSQNDIEASYEMAVKFPQDHPDSSPASVWGMAQGITRLSQQSKHADARVKLDRIAGKVLEMAF